jgi:ABC-type multidrug transport system ATPase subunit/ABC-type multidrug transport system permease subunit
MVFGRHTPTHDVDVENPPVGETPGVSIQNSTLDGHQIEDKIEDDLSGVSAEDVEEKLDREAKTYMESVATFTATFFDDTATKEARALSLKRSNSLFDVEMENGMQYVDSKIKVSLQFTDLTYSVCMKKKKGCFGRGGCDTNKVILDGITAYVPPARLVAVMGPTGCGKTSLINALAGRLEASGELEGEILVNGKPRNKSFKALVAYVMQDDVLFANLTVQETFEFAARMRLPRTVPNKVKDALVRRIINELGLSKAKNTRIGNAIYRGVSGGERKRTNIGVELLSGASLIFLDEPTSGLDAFQAMNVMESLWTLASNGRTIITTIHQPRSSIFKMFDILLLLSEGKTMFYGPARDAVDYFNAAHFPCPQNFNPADFFLDVVSMDFRSKDAEESSRVRISLLARHFEGMKDRYQYAINDASRDSLDYGDSCDKELVVYPNDPLTEFALLLKRSWKQQSRDKLPLMITLVQTVVIGFVLAALYSNMGSSSTPVQDETGILFFITIFSAFGAMFSALNTFPTERGVVNRERASKMYHVLPYYCARFICDIPIRVGQGLLFGCIVYWIVGLNPAASAFFTFCAMLIVEGLTAQGMGVAISAAAPNEKVAFAIAPAITVILILVGGFYVNQDSVPDWIGWLKYVSHLYWAYMGLAINDFAGREGWNRCVSTAQNGTCIIYEPMSGDDILYLLGFNANHLWLAFVCLLALLVFYNGMGYIFLRRSKQKVMALSDIKPKSKHV